MVPHQVMMAIIKMTRYTRIEMDSNKYVNTTSNFKYNWPVKKLDTENWTMTSIATEYGFYKHILNLLLNDFINYLIREKVIDNETVFTIEKMSELYLNGKLTYIPIINKNECYIKNIINSEKIIIYNYSDLSDLTIEDCLIKMLNDLRDLYNLDD